VRAFNAATSEESIVTHNRNATIVARFSIQSTEYSPVITRTPPVTYTVTSENGRHFIYVPTTHNGAVRTELGCFLVTHPDGPRIQFVCRALNLVRLEPFNGAIIRHERYGRRQMFAISGGALNGRQLI
jgi:hypothetical protein